MKRLAAILLVLAVFIACTQAGAESKTLEGKPYPNSNLYGNWPDERPGPEESFELYVNYDAYREALANGGQKDTSTISRITQEVREQILELCRDPEQTDTEAEILRILYGMLTDTESIEREGSASLTARVDRVKAVKTLNELNGLLQEEGFLITPALFSCDVRESRSNPGKASVTLFSSDALDDLPVPDDATEEELAAEPRKDTETPRKILVQMGYSEEEAAHLVEEMVRYDDPSTVDYSIDAGFEVDFSAGSLMLSLREIHEKYPLLYSLLAGLGCVSKERESEPMYETDQWDLLRLLGWYREENLDVLKAILILSLYHDADRYLDQTALQGNPEEELYRMLTIAGIAMDQAYLNHYSSAEKWETTMSVFEEIREAMRERIRRNSWMDEDTKKKAEEKLDLIGIVHPEAEGGAFDCEPLLTALRKSENMIDAVAQCRLFKRKCMMRYAGREISRTNIYLFSEVPVLGENAKAMLGYNMIGIGAPMLNSAMFDDSSRETLLATFGYLVAHELGHFFDPGGVLQDATGTRPIYTEEDGKRFEEKEKSVHEKLSAIELLDGVPANGNGIAELLPDLTGMSLVLDLAKKTEGFDYDRFFRTYAHFYFTYDTDREQLIYMNNTDLHPAGYIRVNYVVAQFEEFYRTYPSVTEGTPMYIAPEDRVLIW